MTKEFEIQVLVEENYPFSGFDDEIGQAVLHIELTHLKRLLIEHAVLMPEDYFADINYEIFPRRKEGAPTVVIFNEEAFYLHPTNYPSLRGGSYLVSSNSILNKPY